MRFGRSVLGVLGGVLLALGVVALACSGLNPYVMQAISPTSNPNQTTGTSTKSMTTTNTSGAPAMTSGSNTTNYSPGYATGGAAPLYSHLDSFARQPITLTGFVLLPIFAALLFGFVLYRVSKVRNERKGPLKAA
ncbi:MAG: hypothetical protein ABSB29_09430 [Nitrososphaerales archaeon]|jgi:hypothetical protein